MSAKAKVFMNGRSQAIRLPIDFRVKGESVLVTRVPEGILITEQDPWDMCEAACKGMSESVLTVLERRNEKLKLEQRQFRD